MLLSIVVPIYNDGYLVEDFCINFQKVMSTYLGAEDIAGQVEVIFVNDGSPNNSLELIQAATRRYPFTKYIELSRNFGQHIAISCGYHHAQGNYVGMMNVDMEDHPDQIPILLKVLREEDCDLALSMRTSRKVSFFEKLTSSSFNWVLNKLTRSDIPLNTGTLRIMNSRYLAAYNSLQERSRFIPGLESWLGFKVRYIPIENRVRTRGKSSYSFYKRLKMAVESIISFSDFPLRIVATAGLILSAVGVLLTFLLIIGKLFFIDFRPGYTSTISIIIFLGGLQIFVVGLASIYIGRILTEVQGRPLYVVRSKGGFLANSDKGGEKL